MNSLSFRSLQAVEEPETCRKFIEGHRKVLEVYGITMITSNNAIWTEHKNTYVIVAESPYDGTVLGGVRLQIADTDFNLPIVDAVGKVDARIVDIVNNQHGRIAEACGLWNSREIAGMGVSFFLLRAAIALAHRLQVNVLYALAAPVTVEMCENAGFEIERNLGKNGFFNYPKLGLVATAMKIDDLTNLPNATEVDRNHIFNVRETPQQTTEIMGPKGRLSVKYFLK
jgi:hypothetical protein